MISTNVYLLIDAGLLTFFLLLNGFYAFILLLGFPVLIRKFKETGSEELNELLKSDHVPPISIIIPAHNEREIIHETISSVYHLDYPYVSLIVVNDGSTDGTLEVLIERYELSKVPPAIPAHLKTQKVRAIYRSKKLPNFIVVDKEKESQEDALNAGLNACTTPYYLATDADAMIEPDVLRKLARTLLTRPQTMGLGGALRVGNGCIIEDGLVKQVRLGKSYLTKMQTLEYLRGFFFGRLGWNMLGGPYNLSGAFNLYEKKTAIEVGGYGKQVPASDLDLTIRMHGKVHELKQHYNIEYVPDACIWLEVPQGYKDLSLQRQRWSCSLLDVCAKYKYMFVNPKYGRIGFLYLPYLILGEGIGPIVEAFAYLYVPFTFFMGVLNTRFLFLFLIIAWGFTSLLTFISIAMEQTTFKKYLSTSDVLKLIGLTFIENFGYRQMSIWWRIRGFFRFFSKNRYYREHPTRHSYKEE